jgi:hypothetical protein
MSKSTHRTAAPLLAALTALATLGLTACASGDKDDMQAPPAEAAPAAATMGSDAMPPAQPTDAQTTDPNAPPAETDTPPPASGTP